MKKLLLLVPFLLFAACGEPPAVVEDVEEEVEEVEGIVSIVESIDDSWYKHEDLQHKYSLMIPKTVTLYDCESEKKEVEFRAITDGEKAYFGPNTLYEYSESGCQEKDVLKMSVSDLAGAYPSWHLVVGDVKNDEEVSEFLKGIYGQGCGNWELGEEVQSGTYSISIETTGPEEPEESLCFLNWVLVVRYSPDLGKIATWSIGQDANFYSADGTSLDLEMAGSFTFGG